MDQTPTPIRCSNCNKETGAYFAGGDPYLPSIICTDCAEGECTCGWGGVHDDANPRCERNQ